MDMENKLKKGDIVKVVGNTSRHGFMDGEYAIYSGETDVCNYNVYYKFEYMDGHDFWHMKDCDFKLTHSLIGEVEPTLFPCPMCGGEVKIEHSDVSYWIACECGLETKIHHSYDELVEYWNRRV